MNQKNKLLITGALLFLLTFSATATILPFTAAHTPAWSIPTYAYIVASPNPVGVNQPAFIIMWVDKVLPSAAIDNDIRHHDYKLTITKPDGTTETKTWPIVTDTTSSQYTIYTPSQTGTYQLKFEYAGQVYTWAGAYQNDTYLPSSAQTTLTVQQGAVELPQTYPLPTTYWSRPIEGQNTQWANIASNWLSGAAIFYNVQPDGLAPNSAHVMWTKPLQDGGIVGGTSSTIPSVAYYTGMSYEGKFNAPIIMQGRLYYPLPLSNNVPGSMNTALPRGGGYVCVDLQTGQQIWYQNYSVYPTFGQLFDYESGNQHGVIAYLWAVSGTRWDAYEPETGNWVYALVNVPAGTQDYTSSGEIVRYVLNVQNKWLALWNNTAATFNGTSTTVPGQVGSVSGAALYYWRPVGKVIDASTAYSWNVTIPALATGTSIRQAIANDVLLVSSGNFGGIGDGITGAKVTAISLKPTSRGQVLWSKDFAPPQGNVTRQFVFADAKSRMFFMLDKETMAYWGYSLDTGNQVWGPTAIPSAYDYYSSTVASYNNGARSVAYGNLYVTGFGGLLYCIDAATGQMKWTYGNGGIGNSTNSGLETPWGNYPNFIGAIADGKVYIFSSEHSANVPLYKGEKVRAIDAQTGNELWTISSWGQSGQFYSANGAIADGYYAYLNSYDQQVYVVGKGPSTTTISAPQTVVPQGTGILLTGTVTDVSAGAKEKVANGEFSVVPAMSDANMSAWMEYIYMQKPMPTDATGVTVKLSVADSSGNSIDVGTAITDTNGKYALVWTPTNEGTYHITATFESTNSYWGSQDTAYVAVGPAIAIQPTATPTPTETVAPTETPTQTASATPTVAPQPDSGIPTETLLIIGAAVVIIAVVAAAAILLRKRA